MVAYRIAAIGLVASVAGAAAIPSAEARIRCEGRYQVTSGGDHIATPYCEDRYLARVAIRSYGVSTSAAAIRRSISEKERVCRFIGHDSRVFDICLQFRDDRGDRFRR